MTDTAREALDALDLLMQDHRELESLFRDFDYLQRTRKDTTAVVAAACAEIKMHDTIKNDVFYSAIADVIDGGVIETMLNDAEDEHDTILELMETLERARDDSKTTAARFAVIADRMKKHMISEETKLFPLVRELEGLDLTAVGAAIMKRRPELLA